jgi:hypothetical protein
MYFCLSHELLASSLNVERVSRQMKRVLQTQWVVWDKASADTVGEQCPEIGDTLEIAK